MSTYPDFDTMTDNPEWLGFGYIGSRRHLNETDRAAGDALAIVFAEEQNWTDGELFDWANSKSGRHYADAIDGGDYDLGWRELCCYPERVGASLRAVQR